MGKNITLENARPPKVTVLMPVYNGEKYLKPAIESILDQTLEDFEFLIVDDGSSDRSVEVISAYNDRRVRIVHNGRNLGIVASLNRGIELATGEYIARMDSDDISLRQRLERQVAFMDKHPDVVVAGSWVRMFSEKKHFTVRYPADPAKLRCYLFYTHGLAHPTAIMRAAVLKQSNLYYDDRYRHAEDYELWTRAVKVGKIANIPEILLLYRISGAQITASYRKEQIASAARVRENQLSLLGITPDERERRIHESIMDVVFSVPVAGLVRYYLWIGKLYKANRETGTLPQKYFSLVLVKFLIKVTLMNFFHRIRIAVRGAL